MRVAGCYLEFGGRKRRFSGAQSLGITAFDLFRVEGVGCRVKDLRLRVWRFGFRGPEEG